MEDIPRRITKLFSIRRYRNFRRSILVHLAEIAQADRSLFQHPSRVMKDTDRLFTVSIEAGLRNVLIITLERTALSATPFSVGERAAVHFMCELISDELCRRSSGSKETGNEMSLREWEVADLVRLGLTNREIAARLDITEATVKRHLYNVFNKTGLDSRTSLVRFLRESETI